MITSSSARCASWPFHCSTSAHSASKSLSHNRRISALDAYTTAVGAATQATVDRKAAVKELGAWVKQFGMIAGVALKLRPDLLKRLGL
jgi:hypothetical protein